MEARASRIDTVLAKLVSKYIMTSFKKRIRESLAGNVFGPYTMITKKRFQIINEKNRKEGFLWKAETMS